MGFHPLFSFNCRRRSGVLFRALAPHQAKPGLLSGGVTSIKEPPVAGFHLPGFRIASRATFRRQEIRSPPDRSRSSNGALGLWIAHWAPWKVLRLCNLFSRHAKPAPERPQRQHETDTEMICEGASAKCSEMCHGSEPANNRSLVHPKAEICIPLQAVLWSRKGEFLVARCSLGLAGPCACTCAG